MEWRIQKTSTLLTFSLGHIIISRFYLFMFKILKRMVRFQEFFMLSMFYIIMDLSSVQSLSYVQLFATPWTTARQASLSVTNSQSLLKLMSIESEMPFNHLIHYHPLLFPPSIFPSIRVFSNESVLCIRWPKYWSFSFSISPSNEYSELIFFLGWAG